MRALAVAGYLAVLMGWPVGAAERLPAVNLRVDLRWVESSVSTLAQAATRDGAVVIGTGGMISPRGAPKVVDTGAAGARIQSLPSLTVANGAEAQWQHTEREPVEWVEAAIEWDPAGPASGPARVLAAPRHVERLRQEAYRIGVSWPGGRQPARVTFMVDGSSQVASSVLLPLDTWHSVARTAGAAPASSRGTVSTQDVQPQISRELQIRVSPQP